MQDQEKVILAIVGMPGAGKTEAVSYFAKKGLPFVRFGEITDEGVQKELGLPLTPENERMYREKIRKELGMAAYAIKAKPKIEKLIQNNDIIAIDGLYSWEEYTLLKNEFPNLILIHIYAEPPVRYKRLSERPIRPVPAEKSRERDITELALNKGGPIAMADYLVENSAGIEELAGKLDVFLKRLHIA